VLQRGLAVRLPESDFDFKLLHIAFSETMQATMVYQPTAVVMFCGADLLFDKVKYTSKHITESASLKHCVLPRRR